MLDNAFKIRFNILMSEEISQKVINIFSKHIKNKPTDYNERVKFFAGFSYVRLDKDVNGYPFKEEKLLDYAKDCHYLVKVMRQKDGYPALYSYNVPSEKLIDFLIMFKNNELNGHIIEIDKFLPKSII